MDTTEGRGYLVARTGSHRLRMTEGCRVKWVGEYLQAEEDGTAGASWGPIETAHVYGVFERMSVNLPDGCEWVEVALEIPVSVNPAPFV